MISKKDRIYLERLIKKYEKLDKSNKNIFPLLEKGFTSLDILKGIEVLLSKKITMSNITKKFENVFFFCVAYLQKKQKRSVAQGVLWSD